MDDCITCEFGAIITLDRQCECYQGPTVTFEPQPDSSNCVAPCGYNCNSCVNHPLDCDTCLDGSTPVDGNCGCRDGYIFVNDQNFGDRCVLEHECHYTCKSCFGNADPNTCTSCWPNAELRDDGHPSWCDCVDGYYASPTSDNCVPYYNIACSSICGACSEGDPDPTFCTTCRDGAELDPNSDGVCVCKSGYFPNPDAGNCKKVCATGCLSCTLSDETICTACEEGYVLQAFNPLAPSVCITLEEACPENCGECNIENPFTCDVCDELYELKEGNYVCSLIIICHP